MTAMAAEFPDYFRPVRKLFRTPKGILLLLFAGIAALGVAAEGVDVALPGLLGAMAAAAVIDVAVGRLSRDVWVFPSGGLLTAMIVAFVMSPQEPTIVPIAATTLAITSKHMFRTRFANVFNPAAVALVASAVFWDSGQSWWGALPDLGIVGVVVLIAAGWFIADRINKLPLVLTFLGTYFVLFTAATFAGDSAKVAEIFRAPDLHAVLFFALFMLDDPPTCPVRYRDQVVFGVIVAVVAVAAFEYFGWLYYLPAALLVGNLVEAARKRTIGKRRPLPRPAAA
jgi:Na+-translocating ferredoxin:NAD+ oxidoreductase RnfD subunit